MMPRRLVVIPGPAYRPPSFRPPALQLGERKLGQNSPSMNWANIGETIMFAAFGAGAMYAAPILPDPMKTIAMVGGVGLIGYAAYSFLGSSGPKVSETPGKSFQAPTPNQFSAVSGKFVQPVPGSSESWTFFGQNYDVKIMATNPDPLKEVTVTLQIIARETGLPFDYLFNNTSSEYLADSITATLGPKETKEIPFKPSVRLNRWVNPRVAVFLSLNKVSVAGESVLLDSTYVILH